MRKILKRSNKQSNIHVIVVLALLCGSVILISSSYKNAPQEQDNKTCGCNS